MKFAITGQAMAGQAKAEAPHPFREFIACEGGSATVEWVMLTAWSVAFALAVTSAVSNGVESLAQEIENFLVSFEIKTSFDEWHKLESSGAEDETPSG